MANRFLTALPVFNEVDHVEPVLHEVLKYSPDVLVVDDGSTDGTEALLAKRDDLTCLRHEANRGYGAALLSAFEYATRLQYDVLVTIDCDGQHEPQRIPQFVARCTGGDASALAKGTLATDTPASGSSIGGDSACTPDIVSGSRYLQVFPGDTPPPQERRNINLQITDELNRRLGLNITDSFCGFKAYRVAALDALDIHEPGYAMPLELWVQAAEAGLKVVELPVPLIYLEEKRSFGGVLDDGQARLDYYRHVIEDAIDRRASELPPGDARVACSGDEPAC